MRAAQCARLRARQPTCQLGHVIGVQAQSAHLHAGNRTGPANPLLAISTIRAYARTAARAAQPRHRHSSTIRALARTATTPVPPIRCLPSAQSTRLRTWHVGLRRFRHHGCSAIHALAHTATVPVPPICCLASAQSARMRAQQRGQLVDSVSGDAVRPAHLHARQQPTMLPQALSRHASDGTRHSSPATPTRLVHEDALCFLARLEKRIFSLGAGDKHGRDSQAD